MGSGDGLWGRVYYLPPSAAGALSFGPVRRAESEDVSKESVGIHEGPAIWQDYPREAAPEEEMDVISASYYGAHVVGGSAAAAATVARVSRYRMVERKLVTPKLYMRVTAPRIFQSMRDILMRLYWRP